MSIMEEQVQSEKFENLLAQMKNRHVEDSIFQERLERSSGAISNTSSTGRAALDV
jgi:hypothetical protein